MTARGSPTPVSTALNSYRDSLPAHRQPLFDTYRFKEIARKVVGVGSVGTRAWVLLFTGRDAADPLFLQAKQATRLGGRAIRRDEADTATPAAGLSKDNGSCKGSATSCSAGTTSSASTGRPYDFYMRQLWDGKGAVRHRADARERMGGVRPHVRLDPRARARSDG